MIPHRPAEDTDIPLTWDGKPELVLVRFFYGMSRTRFIGSGWRRPRKVRGQWMVRKWGDRHLMVRKDLDTAVTPFVVAP